MPKPFLYSILALLAVAFIDVAPAEACMNTIHRDRAKKPAPTRDVVLADSVPEIERRTEEVTNRRLDRVATASSKRGWVDRGTDQLNAGQNQLVIRGLYEVYGSKINQWALNPRATSSLQREVVQLVALASLRTEGAFYRDRAALPAPPDVQPQNVKWAILAIENLAFVGAVPERHRAEAWARDPALQNAAIDSLKKLAEDRRLESPYQATALARLLRASGDEDGAREAERLATRLDETG